MEEDGRKWAHRDEEEWRIVSTIHYYLREQFYGLALQNCTKQTPKISVLKGVCLTLLGKIPEATRHLESINNKTSDDVALGVLYALKWAHLSAYIPDNKSIMEIETEISEKTRDEKCPATSFISAAEVLYFSGEFQKAKQLLERIARKSAEKYVEEVCLLAWIELALGKNQKSTLELFEKCAGQGFPDGYIGRCRILAGHHSANEMKTVAKEMTISMYNFVPGHVEKAKSCLMLKEWQNALDSIQNSNIPDATNPCLEILRTIHSICFSGFNGGLTNSLMLLQKSLEDAESQNHKIYSKIAILLASMSAKDRTILISAKSLISKSLQISRRPEYLAVALRIATHLAEHREVLSISKELTTTDCEDSYAILSNLLGLLMTNRLKDAKAQFEILLAAHPKLEQSVIYHIISAIITKNTTNNFESIRQNIDQALENHRKQISEFHPFSLEYFQNFESDILFTLLEQIFDFAPLIPIKNPDEVLKISDKILTLLSDNLGALSHLTYQLGKCKYLGSNYSGAEQMVKISLEKNETLTDAYILKSQIILDRGGKIQDAELALNTGMNFNFSLRETSLYHLIKAKTLKRKGENEEAVKVLRAALKLPKKEASLNLLLPKEAADTHKISVQLELIETLQLMRRTAEAESEMSSALSEWSGKPEQDQLIISHAQLYVSKGHADKALAILQQIKPGQSNFQISRIKMAEIYLNEKKDKRMFAACYNEIIEADVSSSAYSTLGDAFMSIQEPEQAIKCYETALKMQNKDALLAEKIGEAYVMAHLYAKAVNFYESAMNIYKDKNMRLKLADLLLRLRNFEKCERVLRQPLEKDSNATLDLEETQTQVQFLTQLAQLYQQKEQWDEAFDCFTKAKNLLLRLQSKTDAQLTNLVKREAGKIHYLTADLAMRRRDTQKAINEYKDAISLNDQDIRSFLALAQIYKQQNKLQLCTQMCDTVLQLNRDNDEATLMMGDLLHLKNDAEQSAIHFQYLLGRNPNHYHAMERVIENAWRTGNQTQVDEYFSAALESNPRATTHAGYNYCKGIHERYCGDWNTALQCFNRAKRDSEWREKAIYNMIDICLNPDNLFIGVEEGVDNDLLDSSSDRAMGTKTAEKFLEELKYKPNVDSRYGLMENFILIHTGNKSNINQALNVFISLAGETDPVQSVGAVYGAARAFILLKQPQKAKTMLKRIINHPWSLDDAEYLEKCRLLLADLYISQNKHEQAAKALESILQHNASSLKAFEFFAHLKEKDQKFAEAYKFYEKAWMISRQTNSAIGYKLAWNYLKCKKFFSCIEICHRVLEKEPNYPKIKKEIMDKARAQIRT
ncbi:unnamed protein product [Caenorhabditis angaria]|uniref:Tetratricopeptide repeat protein 21B n=1 Tax=Caenorhabditis angaria TaxID=860376 RepID=A0A9P1IJK9_9PELO|nr:unnamed protein product [Caenorhabditis angaria]